LGDIVGVTGIPAKTKRGEPSLAVTELELLAKIKRPLPDTYHGLTETETRYRQRYLDLLMSEESRAEFELRARMVAAIRRYLDDHGFIEVETPILQPRYGGGARVGSGAPPQQPAPRHPPPSARPPSCPPPTSSTRTSTCALRPSSTSSGSSSAASSASTSWRRTSATRACPTSTRRNSRWASGTRPTRTTATRWPASRSSSRPSRSR